MVHHVAAAMDRSAQSHPQEEIGWLLRLSPPLERQFFQEGSVQGMYILLDLLALTQALILNWYLLRKFGRVSQEDTIMLPHERVMSAVFFIGALLQMVCMAAWPQQYRVHRQRAAMLNRFLRLVTLLVGAVLIRPAHAWQQVQAFHSVFAHSSSTPPGQDAFMAVQDCLSAQHCPAPAHGLVAAASVGAAASSSTGSAALWKALLLSPVINMMHANWLVPFWVAVAMQAVTFVTSVHNLFAGICGIVHFQWPASATIVPACQQLNWLMYAAGQLLDWQVHVDPGQASTASDAVCADPVVALVLLQVWVRLVLLVLVPCGGVYCLERSLKVRFLHTRYASNIGAAASILAPAAHQQAGLQHPRQQLAQAMIAHTMEAGPSSSSGFRGVNMQRGAVPAAVVPTHMQEQQQLESPLLAVRPASLCELLSRGNETGAVRLLLGTGLALSAVLVCWLLCEVVLLALLKGGQRFVCGADGWLRLQ